MSQELIDSVNNLTSQTTALLNEYKDAKRTVDGKVNQAAQSVVDAENVVAGTEDIRDEAAVHAATAETHKDTASSEADRASTEADRAYTEAERAKSEADRAAQVTGLDTVEDAIDLEMQNHNPYGAITKAEFDALRENRKREDVGSGFREWGLGRDNGGNLQTVDNGFWMNVDIPNTAKMGVQRNVSVVTGSSRTEEPIVNVDGVQIHIDQVNFSNSKENAIAYPPAPDGTKTLDSNTGEVRKYHDLAGVGTKHEVYTPNFDTNTYIKLPTYSMAVGSVMEFKVIWAGVSTGNQYIIDSDSDTRAALYISSSGNVLRYFGLATVKVNGTTIANNTFVIEDGVEYHITAQSSVTATTSNIGSRNDGADRFNGEIWDIKLEDPELPSGFRHYRNLVHQDASLDAPDTNVIPVVEKGSLEAGWQVNYENEGFADVPTFPLADSMDISVSLRTDDTSIDTQFGQGSSNWLRFANLGSLSTPYFQIRVGSANFAGFDVLNEGGIYECSVQIRKNADPAVDYTVTATVNEQSFTNSSVVFSLDEFEYFGIGGYGDGSVASQRWKGNIWDFKLEYPDAPDLNRYYKGIEPEDPQGRLTLIDEEGFTDKDWGAFGDTASNKGVRIPEWTPTNYANNEVSMMVLLDSGLGGFRTLWSSGGNSDTRIYVDTTTGELSTNGCDNLLVNGVEGSFMEFDKPTHLQFRLARRDISMLGATGWTDDPAQSVVGGLWDVRLTDLDNPENSRHYPLVINSATQPADDAPIVDELYDEATAPFYAPDWNYQSNLRYVRIPDWDVEVGSVVEFKVRLSTPQDDNAQVLIDSADTGNRMNIEINVAGELTYPAGLWQNVTIDGIQRSSGHLLDFDGEVHTFRAEAQVTGKALGVIGNSAFLTHSVENVIYDISLTNPSDSAHNRFYRGVTYSPDAVPTGTVLEETGKNAVANGSFDSDLSEWVNGNNFWVWDSGRAYHASEINWAPLSQVLSSGTPNSITFDYEVVAGGLTVITSTNADGNAIDRVDLTGTGTHTLNVTGGNSIQFGRSSGQGSGEFYVDNVVANYDGTLVNFPTNSEWTLAQVSGLTEGTPENFTGDVWNNDLPTTDATLTGFTTEWEEVKFYDAELVGTTVWQPSSLQDSQKAFDWASISNAEVITSRKDLSFLEVWDEKVSDKGVLCRYGNTQYGGSGTPITSAGIAQGYSAFGEWDEATVGNVEVVANMTEAELKAFHADPKNNTWWDPEDGEYWQTRYRIRTIEGLGNLWSGSNAKIRPENTNVMKYFDTLNRTYVGYQGKSVKPTEYYDLVGQSGRAYALHYGVTNGVPNDHIYHAGISGSLYPSTVTDGGAYSIPLTLTQRLNQGAYHPQANLMGTAQWRVIGVDGHNLWYNLSSDIDGATTEDCFFDPEGMADGAYGRYTGSGYIGGNQPTGRSDQYDFYDAIYAGQVEDLRLSANKQDTDKLLEDNIRKAVRGEVRGKGKVPFTKFDSSIVVGTGSHVAKAEGLRVQAASEVNKAYVYADWREGQVNVGDRVAVWNTKRNTRYSGKVTSIVLGSEIYITIEQSLAGNDYSNAAEDIVFALEAMVSAEYDSLPWVDIIGDPERIAATFPMGVVGQWIPQDVSSTTEYSLNVKANSSSAVNTRTTDDGATWTSSSVTLNTVPNTYTWTTTANHVGLIHYEALSDFTESADNSTVVGKVGDVFGTSGYYQVQTGNRLMSSLIGEIGVNSAGDPRYLTRATLGYQLDPNSNTNDILAPWDGYAPYHDTFPFIEPTNDSHAVKALATLTEKDGLLYLQLQGAEMVHNGTDWGDSSKIPIVDGDSTQTDLNGNTVKTFTHHTMIPFGIASNE